MDIKYDFFISYNHKDEKFAEWIAWILEKENYQVFIQAWDFQPGNNFVLQMQKGSANSKHTLALLSNNYLSALNTQPEWAAAFASDPTGVSRKFIPVRIEDIKLEGLLSPIIYIDLVGKNEEEAKQSILEGIKRERQKPPIAPLFPGIIEKKENNPVTSSRGWYATWLDKRISEIENGKDIFKIPKGPKFSLHLIPIEALSQSKVYSPKELSAHKNLKPLFTYGWDPKVNKEGFAAFVRGQQVNETHSYVQFYRNGIIEAVESGLLSLGENTKEIIIDKFEKEIIEHVKLHYLKVLKGIGIRLPIAIGICLYDIEGYRISSYRTANRLHKPDAIEQSKLELPVIQINSWEDSIDKALQPSFDLLWNHCGLEGSLNYDKNENWNEYRGY
ncbi:toll/interleukin-1 receptor domain-containing protein [Planococcus lenghuensis]|uniref:TIR domain-containing protein n=1 Tax=Planococcus lenghuensis TaxID=2213202 RepID=A0A1Q2L573_9BACL|nr:toll/interleukin-1 receptor domain-containing protein [Planococcus lenghuensis]AQQ55566.1 hypothetical protein B0X71_20550 [Planococcus lenghuensis]